MAKAAYPTIGIAALVMFGIVYFIGCLHLKKCLDEREKRYSRFTLYKKAREV